MGETRSTRDSPVLLKSARPPPEGRRLFKQPSRFRRLAWRSPSELACKGCWFAVTGKEMGGFGGLTICGIWEAPCAELCFSGKMRLEYMQFAYTITLTRCEGGWVMFENDANNSPSQNDEYSSSAEYLRRAAKACASGDAVLGMHLYLAAFEQARHDDDPVPSEDALGGLKQAWLLACKLKERSIAEYVFERLEPYLTVEETSRYAEQLQDLALDKLEEYGLTREDLEDMTDMISQDFLGMGVGPLMKVEHITTAPRSGASMEQGTDAVKADAAEGAVAGAPERAEASAATLGESTGAAEPASRTPGARILRGRRSCHPWRTFPMMTSLVTTRSFPSCAILGWACSGIPAFRSSCAY